MRYMVIEEYTRGPGPVYERAATQGRMLPEGLRYIDSWVVDDGRLNRCFQLMETDDPELLGAWQARWADLVDFDVVPVITSSEAAQRSGAWQPPPPGAGDTGAPDLAELPAATANPGHGPAYHGQGDGSVLVPPTSGRPGGSRRRAARRRATTTPAADS